MCKRQSGGHCIHPKLERIFIGNVSGYTYIGEAGDIAKARFGYAGSDPYSMEDFRNIDNTMFNYEMIKDRWVKWGIVPDKRISFHCGTGWRASETYWYSLALGYPDIHVYDGRQETEKSSENREGFLHTLSAGNLPFR